MGFAVKINTAQFANELREMADNLHAATRPAAQAGALVVYDRARAIVAAELTSQREHWFYGQATKALPRGEKKAAAYGPFKPGSLHDAIYQVFSKDNSFRDVSTYHVSWNATKAPYGGMVEVGTSNAPAHSFIGRAFVETRDKAREAMKQRFISEISK